MADPICRWRNSSIKQLIEFNSIFPLIPLEKKQGRDYVEKNWQLFGSKDFFTTPYQLAAQMGVYYEDDHTLYPRFTKLININEACEYMYYWGKNYYVPNPYTKSIQQNKSVVINNFLVNWAIDKGLRASFTGALTEMFASEIGNTDILINMLNNFSEVKVENDIVSLKDATKEKYEDSDIWIEVDSNNKEVFFKFICKNNYNTTFSCNLHTSFQQIYYGAPGTGKSHTVKKQTAGESVIRTTFHPDSDYSTFVGCYKPSMGGGLKDVISTIELKKKLFDIKLKGEPYPCQKFGAQYWNSLANLSQADVKDILTACGFTESMSAEIGKGISVGREMYSNTESCIVYEFVEQAFLKAYVKAWKFYAEAENNAEPKKQYLIIEEINRGNCAQIFGDLFQLLDRNSAGFSDYSIHADKDMRRFLEKEFRGVVIDEASKEYINAMYNDDDKDVVSKVLSGEILLLPSNLYIWATMNTSDQSLFPIDSAFKRRWDWVYTPIKQHDEDYKIAIGDDKYDWWGFLEKINQVIDTATNSEDKKLGYFFVKASDKVITADKFVGKVLFYLWNDVFKNYGFDSPIFSKSENKKFVFSDFFAGNGEPDTEMVKFFLKKLDETIDKDKPFTKTKSETVDNSTETDEQA